MVNLLDFLLMGIMLGVGFCAALIVFLWATGHLLSRSMSEYITGEEEEYEAKELRDNEGYH